MLFYCTDISLKDVLAHGAGNHKNRHLTEKIDKSHEKYHEIHHHLPSSKLMKMIQNLVDVQVKMIFQCINPIAISILRV